MNNTLTRILCIAAGVGALAARLIAPLPPTQDYAARYGYAAPAWLVPVGAFAGMLAMSGRLRPGRVRTAVFGIAMLLLLWASGGLVLDAFRFFFWATGIPAGDFAIVDGRGAVARLAGAVGLVAVAAAYVAGGRVRPDVARRPGRPLAVGGLALAAFYPATKFYWSAGGTVLRPGHYTEKFPVGETVMLVGAAVLVLLLALYGGRRRLIRVGLLGVGSVVTLVLLNQGLLPLFGLANHALGAPRFAAMDVPAAVWTVDFVLYISWALLGLVIGWLALGYHDRTRPAVRVRAKVAA
ncbi:MAG TPA: hypothetical protein VEO01_04365 [Pseudonocardiaceae bacterium]|nr:hypothetical protein [Pseudonocardiaceae bacterium]